ncbi:MAG: hypothetical protein HGB03_00370 [Candidatus Yonathbacteria bacterium]|nr:hypothetical protein [Candidatus Yonathbacteria bacterium]NTW47721.1 hypothetical protein [Candidatus Yonathbacteria bacterium]
MPVKTFVREYSSVEDGTIKEIFESLDNEVYECFRNMEIDVADSILAMPRGILILRKVTYRGSPFYPPGAD